jgi:hypothetical protein
LITAIIIKNDSTINGIAKAFAFTKVIDLLVMKTGIAKQNFRPTLINNSIHVLMIYLATRFKKWIYIDLKPQKETLSTIEDREEASTLMLASLKNGPKNKSLFIMEPLLL